MQTTTRLPPEARQDAAGRRRAAAETRSAEVRNANNKKERYMPMGNGTGPSGLGPGTGRGRGWCRTGIRRVGSAGRMFRGRGGLLRGVAATIIVAAVRDLTNPSGLLRRAVRALLPYKKNGGQHIIHDAEYSVLDENLQGSNSAPEQSGKEIKK